jgi:alpha-D-ribose 1-methylphosphonate 5-triphosphate synthase subunit PhnL
MLGEDILTITNLKKYFPTQKAGLYVRAVDDISFTVRSGEVVGLGRRIGIREKHNRLHGYGYIWSDSRQNFFQGHRYIKLG